MLRDYQELMEEVKEITTIDGFVWPARDQGKHVFYERDLMLAAFSASLELLAVVVTGCRPQRRGGATGSLRRVAEFSRRTVY